MGQGSVKVRVPVHTTTFSQFTAALPTPLPYLMVNLSKRLSSHDKDETIITSTKTRRLRRLLGWFTAKPNDAHPHADPTSSQPTAAEAGSEVTLGELSLSISWNICFPKPTSYALSVQIFFSTW
jgi:hypothetical protein